MECVGPLVSIYAAHSMMMHRLQERLELCEICFCDLLLLLSLFLIVFLVLFVCFFVWCLFNVFVSLIFVLFDLPVIYLLLG